MPKKSIEVTELNIAEWIHSTGHLLPRNDIEHSRFNLLYSSIERTVMDEQVDPFKILNGIWKPKAIILMPEEANINDQITELRMAARNHTQMPEHILNKIKKNQPNK